MLRRAATQLAIRPLRFSMRTHSTSGAGASAASSSRPPADGDDMAAALSQLLNRKRSQGSAAPGATTEEKAAAAAAAVAAVEPEVYETYQAALNGFFANAWSCSDIGKNWTVWRPHAAVESAYGLHHWRNALAYGYKPSAFVLCFSPSPQMHRWAVVDFAERTLTVCQTHDGAPTENSGASTRGVVEDARKPDVERLPGGATYQNGTTLATVPIPPAWLVAFKRVRWPARAQEMGRVHFLFEDEDNVQAVDEDAIVSDFNEAAKRSVQRAPAQQQQQQ
eukprot:TRINITY_DN7486_c0_g1_i1.p1 TRINITY_DN7486_c0_g1~~TRINITY_DN7486_c0_g1_i1.p1  ORF type:complete len:292 (-),score=122.07 TRINITY_DN7486_c0_g1_i1:77-910(-)